MEQSRVKTLNVLMTGDTVGGVWTYCVQLIRAMAPFKVNYTLVTMGGKCSEEQRREAKKLKNINLIETAYKTEWMDNPWEDVNAGGSLLLKLEETLKPDIIHLNDYASGALNFKAPKLIVGHSCVYSWWKEVKKEAPPAWCSEYFRRVKKGLTSADHVVAPSNFMMESLNENYGSFKSQAIIPNARDRKLFAPERKLPYVFSMGRIWDEAKNIKALAQVSHKLSWPVFIAGNTTEPFSENKTSFLKNSNACFLGNLDKDEVSERLAQASIFVLPVKYEPFGLSVLEAALSGCALILGDIPSMRENWSGAAAFVNPDDMQELEEVIECLINHPSQRNKLAEQAKERAKEFAPAKMATAYFNSYRNLLRLKNEEFQGVAFEEKVTDMSEIS
jgi:glycogen synthase